MPAYLLPLRTRKSGCCCSLPRPSLPSDEDESMQSYPLIGGAHDGLDFPAPDDAESIQIPVGITGQETYIRDSLSVGDVSIVFYRHEGLGPEQALNRLVEYYKAWAIHMPNGRR